jgi:hypothetical protein
MTRAVKLIVALAAVLVVFGCSKEKAKEEGATETTAQEKATEPDYISVQHILIGFQGSLPGKPVSRTKEEAEQLANEIFAKVNAGEDFDALVKEYTDDAYPGIYKMANFGVPADRANMVYPRQGMVPAFGDVGFPLAVGEVGMAAYDAQKSPYGWHIIKRVE